MEEKEIKAFLLRAKKATYAGEGRPAPPSRPASKDFVYEEGNAVYLDSYFGSDPFIGEELVRIGPQAVWGMNYVGRKADAAFDYAFLKEALREAEEALPLRGPTFYMRGDLVYRCSVQGDFSFFRGQERIERRGELVYEGVFHGGRLR